jgi:hypothetical protein
MSDFKVTFQTMPFCNSSPQAMLVSCVASKEEAFVLAYDQLTRQGHVVTTYDGDLRELDLDISHLRRAGVDSVSVNGSGTKIRGIDSYNVKKPKGSIQPCTV